MPAIIGSEQELDVDEEMACEPQPQGGPSFLLQALTKISEAPEIVPVPRFVAPTSFYGQAVQKSKPKGPL